MTFAKSALLQRCLAAAMALSFGLPMAPWGNEISAAQPLSIEIRKVEIGYGGIYKSGFWTPIWITLRSSQSAGGIVEVMAPDGDGVPVAFAASGVDGNQRIELAASDNVNIR